MDGISLTASSSALSPVALFLQADIVVKGVMIGVELSIEGAPIVKACMEKRLLINCTHGTVLRLLPAMNLTEKQAQQGCDIIAEAIKEQVG